VRSDRRPLRLLSWLLLAVGVLAAAVASAAPACIPSVAQTGWQNRQQEQAPATLPSYLNAETCLALAELSGQAAALTGSLALVEAAERPAQAGVVARATRALAARAKAVDGGASLVDVLAELARALEGYATGDASSLAQLQQASARNAQLRAQYELCGGER